MSFELIIRLSDIKEGLCVIGLIGLFTTFTVALIALIGDAIKIRIVSILFGIFFLILILTGMIMPNTEQYLAIKLAEENTPKTAEEALEIIKKSKIEYHHIRAEQYKGQKE
jgi:hypothetical protein